MSSVALGILALIATSFAIACAGTRLMIWLSPRIGFTDKPGGRKIHANPKPLGGGVAITAGLLLPLLAGVVALTVRGDTVAVDVMYGTSRDWSDAQRQNYIYSREFDRALGGGAYQQRGLAIGLAGAILALHVMGLIDDRRALGPYSKLIVQLGVTAALVISFNLRAMTFLDQHVGGPWLSMLVTVLWIGAITNAFNFLDNMDGLSAGVAAICTLAFLVTACLIGQWFVAATLACLLGATLGFLVFNFPPARIFMGDSGSLVLGFVLGVLTVRTTFLLPGQSFVAGWYALFAPLIVLALPLYDLVVVSAIRLSRGKSPFVGDKNHFSHRLVDRGMSRRTAVLCLYLVTAATSVAAIVLPHARSGFIAALIVGQTAMILGVVMLLEQHPLPRTVADDDH